MKMKSAPGVVHAHGFSTRATLKSVRASWRFDPVFDGETPFLPTRLIEENPHVAFGRFVNLMRRQQGR